MAALQSILKESKHLAIVHDETVKRMHRNLRLLGEDFIYPLRCVILSLCGVAIAFVVRDFYVLWLYSPFLLSYLIDQYRDKMNRHHAAASTWIHLYSQARANKDALILLYQHTKNHRELVPIVTSDDKIILDRDFNEQEIRYWESKYIHTMII